MTEARERFALSRRRLLLGAAATLGVGITHARAQIPAKTITIVVPFPAGGTTDLLARAFGQRMSVLLGQSVIIENKGGAGGSIGAEAVARSTPDGTTLLFHNLTFSTTTVAMQLANRSKHDIFKDFVPISLAANVPMLVVTSSDVKAKDLKDFVSFAKSSTTPLNYGSTGPGSVMNLAIEIFKRDTKLPIEHVPFRGAAPLIQEIVAGRLQLGGDQLSTSIEFVRAGSLKPLATLAAERIPLLPDVPTVTELGFGDMELRGWNGFFAPAGTPAPVVAKLQELISQIAREPEIKQKLGQVGAEPVGSDQQTLEKVVRDQVTKISPLISELKLAIN